MTVYNFSQLEQLWINAGGSRALAPLAAAIAIVESGGNPAALNSNGGASGIWQLIPSNWHLIPGGEANRFNASDNAIGAVRLSGNTLAGLVSNWIDSEPPGAAYAVLKQHGGQLPSGSLPSETGTSGGGGGKGADTSAQLSSSWTNIGSDVLDPFQSVAKSLGSLISAPADIATSVTRLAKDFNSLVGLFNNFFRDIEWLFVPSHWVRIFCFIFGIGALIPGVWALMQTGQGKQGDITMAIGILLITVSGVLLFLAFHNLPTDVTDLAGLLSYVAKGIQAGAAPSDTASASLGNADVSASSIAQTTVNALGPGS